MFFSIIIPVYNAEKSLEACLNSIREQVFEDFETLLIDDGSQDNSYAICKGFAEEDVRFKVIHQKNKGPSAARNEGIKRAKGEYLCFIDSDDFVLPEYLEKLHKKLEKDKAEIIFFGYHSVDQTGYISATLIPPTGMKGTDLLMELSERDMFGYTWIKCFLRELVGDSRFPEDMSLFEDEVFTCSTLEKTNRIEVLSEAIYCYVNDGTAMLTRRTYEDYCTLSDRVYSAWERMLGKTSGQENFLQRKANAFVGRCRYYGLEQSVEVRRYFESLSKTGFFQKHTDWTILDRFVQTKNWIGIKAMIFLYRLKNHLHRKLPF